LIGSVESPPQSSVIRTRIAAVFTDDETFWRNLIVLVGGLAFLKGARLPSLWAATQAQFDYSAGFIKRGLYGELMDLLRIHHYLPFAAFSFLILAVFLVLLWRYVDARRSGIVGLMVAAVFFSSFSFTFLAHLVGYLGVFLTLLTIATLLIPRKEARICAGILVVLCGILIHEMFLFTCLPLLLLDAALEDTDRTGRLRLKYAALLLGTAIGVTLVTTLPRSLPPKRLASYSRQLAGKTDFALRQDCVAVLGRSLKDNLQIMGHICRSGWWATSEVEALFEVAPLLLFLLFVSFGLINRTRADLPKTALKIGVVAISLSPVVLSFLGWDVYRFYAWAGWNCFFAFVILRRRLASGSGDSIAGIRPVLLRNLAIAVIVINLSTGAGLMDGYQPSTFPYQNLVRSWISSVHNLKITPPER
jgi:hypothetical protein